MHALPAGGNSRLQFHRLAVMTTLWAKMHLALGPGLIPRGGQQLRQRRVLGQRLQLAFIADTTERIAVLASHDGGPRRHADWARAVRPSESDAFAAQPVELRCENVLVAQSGNGVKALLIGGDEQNIGLTLDDLGE